MKTNSKIIISLLLIIIIPLIIVFAQKQVISQAIDNPNLGRFGLDERLNFLIEKERLDSVEIQQSVSTSKLLSEAIDDITEKLKELDKDLRATQQLLAKNPDSTSLRNLESKISVEISRQEQTKRLFKGTRSKVSAQTRELIEEVASVRKKIPKLRDLIRRLRGGGFVVLLSCIVGFACADVTEAAVTVTLGPSPVLDSSRPSIEKLIEDLERAKREIENRNEGDIEDIDDLIDDSEDDLDDLDLD